MNPLLLPLIEKEVKKLFDAKMIVSLWLSKWLANLVPVRKKSGEIRLCVDFRNLNQVSLKDKYPLPKTDNILQRVVGSQRMFMLDGFLGYNQVVVHPDDQEKIAFTTPWGTFMYAKMPFGLMNARATFQRKRTSMLSSTWMKSLCFQNQIQTTCSISEKFSLNVENLAFTSIQRSPILQWKREVP